MSNTPTPQRAYRGRSSAMLVGIATITQHAITHAAELQEADSSFTVQYFQDLRLRIDQTARQVLGSDNAGALRSATQDMGEAVEQAAKELRLTKGWIESKYAASPARRDELLNKLGFKQLYTAAISRKGQEELGQLLDRVSKGLDAQLEQEFVSAGLPGPRVTSLRELAASFSAKNIHQETQKGERTARTAADIEALNGLYTEVMGISKLARKLFIGQPVIQASFSFETVAPAARSRKAGSSED